MNHVPWSCKGKIISWPLDLGMGKVKRHLEGERSLLYYKRMPRVVCKTSEEDWERAWRGKWVADFGMVSKEDWEHFPRRNLCLGAIVFYCWGHAILHKSIQVVQQQIGHGNRGKWGHKFWGNIWGIYVGGWSYRREGTMTCWGHDLRGVDFSKVIHRYGLWHDFPGSKWWDRLCL